MSPSPQACPELGRCGPQVPKHVLSLVVAVPTPHTPHPTPPTPNIRAATGDEGR
ncbi:MAG: hypothetical protein F6J93_40190 [Oscillatoria sp. SIO1A7]|nr:hypothetical protein [Oscillatoria sp. SIO1A7]